MVIKKLMENGHSTFQTGKLGNFNSLREVFELYYDTVTLKLTEDGSQCPKSVMVINILQIICIGHVLEAPGLTSRHCCRNLSEKLDSKVL